MHACKAPGKRSHMKGWTHKPRRLRHRDPRRNPSVRLQSLTTGTSERQEFLCEDWKEQGSVKSASQSVEGVVMFKRLEH